MAEQVARRRFTVEEYHQMGAAGILSAHDRVELLDGQIIKMSPIGVAHASVVDRLAALFFRRFASRATVRVQNPVIVDRYSELQPDLMLLRARADFYATKHPEPADVVLLVEVMDSSAGYDRGMKLQQYARDGIREVWLVDLRHQVVEVYRRPALRGYSERREAKRGQRLAPSAFPRTYVSVGDILG